MYSFPKMIKQRCLVNLVVVIAIQSLHTFLQLLGIADESHQTAGVTRSCDLGVE